MEYNFTDKQIADRQIAKVAVFNALMNGRRLSFLDSKEFALSEFHTTICIIRKDISRKGLPYNLCDRWITFGEDNKRCKEYWLEEKEEMCQTL